MSSPALARRRLGAELRRLRTRAGVTVEQAAETLECSISKISRLETGLGVPRARDVRDLIELIGPRAKGRRAELLELAEEGRGQAWYHEFSDVLEVGSTYERFIDLESGAASELVYGGSWMPGLLQTPGYADALWRTGGAGDDAEIGRRVALRMGRKAVLTDRKAPLRFTAIVDESVLWRAAGGPAVMRDQLSELRKTVSEAAENIDVRLMPFAAGIHPLVAGDLTVLQFDGEDQDVVLVEGHAAQAFEERPAEVARATELFNSALELTVGGAQFVDRLTEMLDTEWADQGASQVSSG